MKKIWNVLFLAGVVVSSAGASSQDLIEELLGYIGEQKEGGFFKSTIDLVVVPITAYRGIITCCDNAINCRSGIQEHQLRVLKVELENLLFNKMVAPIIERIEHADEEDISEVGIEAQRLEVDKLKQGLVVTTKRQLEQICPGLFALLTVDNPQVTLEQIGETVISAFDS